MTRTIEFSTRTLLVTAGFLLLLWFLFQVRGIIILLFFSIIIMAALDPLVERLVQWRIPRALAIFLCYIVIFGVLFMLGSIIIAPIIEQTGQFIRRLPEYIPILMRQLNIDTTFVDQTFLERQTETLANNVGNIVNVGRSIFNGFLGVMTLAVFTFYLLLERGNLEQYVANIIAPKHKEGVLRAIHAVESRLGAWVRGELALMTIIGLLSYVGLRLLNVEFALPLAILAGLLELIPVIGPIIALIPAVLIALVTSPWQAAAVGALYFLIQQLENNIIVPKVMEKAVGINPLIIIIAIMAGGKLMGISGALLAVPVLVVAHTLFTLRFREN